MKTNTERVRSFKLLFRAWFYCRANVRRLRSGFSRRICGGSHGDDIAAIALDPSAKKHSRDGTTPRRDFPTANAFQGLLADSFGDAFAKISPEAWSLGFLLDKAWPLLAANTECLSRLRLRLLLAPPPDCYLAFHSPFTAPLHIILASLSRRFCR